MDKICRVMMNLIGSEICGNAVRADEVKALSDEELKALYLIANPPAVPVVSNCSFSFKHSYAVQKNSFVLN